MGLIRITFVFTLIAANAFGGILWDENRIELKKLTVKNHRPIQDYAYSREVVMQKIHLKSDNRGYFIEDVYCHQTFRKNVGPHRMPDHTDINIEHTWPQSRFNRSASKRSQKADILHLYPSETISNSRRGSHYFSEVERPSSVSYDCEDSKIGANPETGYTSFEPPEDHKGNVARALFYFSIRYDIEIPEHEELFLRVWNAMDPVDDLERKRNDVAELEQGNRNPFIDNPDYANTIRDF